ncbi:bifunctional riboflavin kinase/FAD synthetase [Stieleria neptunia]|uniref:bifunctional riboflavin kinase/FAD synthetase n=1 Tax=Stieleria neptunia TaxID=2527979 RepID=UPI0018D25F53|nr:bifunctional riboflavin kinase/FAD synthetase [Stieleria neptunia]
MTEIVSIPDITLPAVDAALQGGVVSIGNFDGVHLGHAGLLGQTRQLADRLGGPAIACLFDPHPIAILRPELAPKRLTSVEERARRMTKLGIDFLVVCQTSPDLLNLSAERFFDALVRDHLKCRGVVEGENFCFGKDRRGDVDLLRTLCRDQGIEFRVAQMESADGAMISSTRIRDLLAAGNVRDAAAMMATPHLICGVVAQGDRRGRTLGFPTANLEQIDVVIPTGGVYAGFATVAAARHPAAIHIGESPTFQSGDPTKVEVHLIGFSGDLYGQTISVELVDRVRGVVRFDSVAAIADQLRKDIQSAQQLLEPS